MKILQAAVKNGLQKNKIFLSFYIKLRVEKWLKIFFIVSVF